MKLLLTALIALSIVGSSRAGFGDGIGNGIGIGIGLGLVNKVLSGGGCHQQQAAQPRERVRHATVVHERTVVHEKAAPAASPSTTVIVNNNLPAQPATQPTNSTTVNAKTVSAINPPAAPAAIPAPPKNADDTTIAKD